VLAEVEVWRGVGAACLVLSGHAVALASGLLGFLLSPTHFQTRTRRTLLSPTIGFRFLVAAAAVPLALGHLRHAHTLLAAGREGGRGVPATLADYVGTLTLGFVLMNLVVASVCAGLLYHLVTPDAATRRLQDFNRRIIVLVSIIDRLALTAGPLSYLGVGQYLVLSRTVHLHQPAAAAGGGGGVRGCAGGCMPGVIIASLVLLCVSLAGAAAMVEVGVRG
jgi:hypothetical protein